MSTVGAGWACGSASGSLPFTHRKAMIFIAAMRSHRISLPWLGRSHEKRRALRGVGVLASTLAQGRSLSSTTSAATRGNPAS